ASSLLVTILRTRRRCSPHSAQFSRTESQPSPRNRRAAMTDQMTDERARRAQQPSFWSLQWPKDLRPNYMTCFPTREKASAYAEGCGDDKPSPVPMYAAPTNPAEIGSKSVGEPTAEHW